MHIPIFIWLHQVIDSDGIRTHNQLVSKRTLDHLPKQGTK